MSDLFDNWKGRTGRAETARLHTEEMERQYGLYISRSVMETKVFGPAFSFIGEPGKYRTEISVEDCDSVGAVFAHHGDGKEAVLNFASYKNPGGMFLNGSRAQEECLCHESTLFNVLRQKKDYYRWNNLHKNRLLYMDRSLYSKDIVFIRNGTAVLCDVITCAAPNINAAKHIGATELENLLALKSRLSFILSVASYNRVDTLILGAFGCGVFGQNAHSVASAFKALLDGDFNGVFRKIVFAIPKRGTDSNYSDFVSVFE